MGSCAIICFWDVACNIVLISALLQKSTGLLFCYSYTYLWINKEGPQFFFEEYFGTLSFSCEFPINPEIYHRYRIDEIRSDLYSSTYIWKTFLYNILLSNDPGLLLNRFCSYPYIRLRFKGFSIIKKYLKALLFEWDIPFHTQPYFLKIMCGKARKSYVHTLEFEAVLEVWKEIERVGSISGNPACRQQEKAEEMKENEGLKWTRR